MNDLSAKAGNRFVFSRAISFKSFGFDLRQKQKYSVVQITTAAVANVKGFSAMVASTIFFFLNQKMVSGGIELRVTCKLVVLKPSINDQ